ncbi:MAG: ion channel [Myxococcota bacterium]
MSWTGVCDILEEYRFSILLFGLLQHLFIAVVLPDLAFYAQVIWPINMVVLGVCSLGLCLDWTPAHRWFTNTILALVCLCPIGLLFIQPTSTLMVGLSVCYTLYFWLLFMEVLRFLMSPEKVDRKTVTAAICGFLMLLEIMIFVMMGIHHLIPGSFKGVDMSNFTAAYLDFVYLSTVVVTSVGFGDITPSHHISKLAVSFMSILAHFYTVVLIGILIGKYNDGDG